MVLKWSVSLSLGTVSNVKIGLTYKLPGRAIGIGNVAFLTFAKSLGGQSAGFNIGSRSERERCLALS